VLIVSTEWPSVEHPNSGIFVSRQVDALRQRGLDVKVFAFRGRARPDRYARAAWQIRRLCREWAPDVVHAHFGQAGFVSTLQRRVPTIVTFHGTDLIGIPATTLQATIKSGLHRLAGRIAAKRAAEVIVVSNMLASFVKGRGCRIIPIPIDSDTYKRLPTCEARQRLGWPVDVRMVLFVGNPANPIKNVELAQRVVDAVMSDVPGLTLRICWNVAPSMVSLQMNAADVLIITSLHEGGPLVAREALACGLPIVSVKVGDIQERLTGVPGCRVCERDVGELAAAVKDSIASCGRLPFSPDSKETSERDLTAAVISVYEQVVYRARFF
jgi:teichuronic acid biosynthesis glycosyltransferase TuaC